MEFSVHSSVTMALRSRWLVSLCIFACSALAHEVSSSSRSCTVTEVYDGDTLTAFCGDESIRIRVSSIDAPEMEQGWGRPARDFARELVDGGVVSVREVDRDQYGRVIAQLTLSDGRDFARTMVSSGFAFHYVRYSRDPELVTFELEAKAANLGIWSFGGSERPYEFRATRRSKSTRGRKRLFTSAVRAAHS